MTQLEQTALYDRLNVSGDDLDTVLRDASRQRFAQEVLTVYRCPSASGRDLNNLRAFNDPYQTFFTGAAHLATSNYIAVTGTRWSTVSQWVNNGRDPWGSFWGGSRVRFRDVSDGLSSTIFIGERDEVCRAGVWAGVRNYNGNGTVGNAASLGIVDVKINEPGLDANNDPLSHAGFSSKHSGGAHYLFGDGSVKFLSENIHFDSIDAATANAGAGMGLYQRLGRRNDGQVVGEF